MQTNTKAQAILNVVAVNTGVCVEEITGKSRRKSVMKAKWEARKLLREKTDLSNIEIMILTGSSENNHRVIRTIDTAQG